MSTEESQPLEPSSEPMPEPPIAQEIGEELAIPVVAEVIYILCWRCGLNTIEASSCTHCNAVLKKEEPKTKSVKSSGSNPKLLSMMLAYVLFLVTSLIYSIILHSNTHRTKADSELGIVVVELIDFAITVSLFFFLGRKIMRRPSLRTRLLTWLLAPFASVGLYFLTHWYVDALRRYVSLDWLYIGSDMEMSIFQVLIVAVQPAIVEELFFRYFAYGTLRQVTNVHSAVVLSALMFALAHLYNPLGLPFLFGMGVALGYARAYSGGLLLPMLMHFGHNFTVLYVESMR